MSAILAGVATYVATQFSPVSAQVDCLGNEDEDINREGRWVACLAYCLHLRRGYFCGLYTLSG